MNCDSRLLRSFGIWSLVTAVMCGGLLATRLHARPPQSSSGTTAPSGNAENGKVLFNKDGCYECHGYGGQGGVTGARLNGNPISFDAFVKYIRAPKVQMPPYTAKVISDQELADVYAFIHTLPKPPDAKSIPLLKDSN